MSTESSRELYNCMVHSNDSTSKKCTPINTNPRVIFASSAVLCVFRRFIIESFFSVRMEAQVDQASKSKRPRVGVRQSLQLTHTDEEAKRRFTERLDGLRQVLTPGSKDNLGLITKLIEIAEDHCRGSLQEERDIGYSTMCSSTFLKSGGGCKWFQLALAIC